MKIILARHGETPWNAAGRYQGQIDIPLSETGEAQAAKLGERLRDVPITRAVSSQLARARATAEAALGESRKAILQIDQRLQEIAHGDWEGLLAQEIAERDPLTFQAWRDAPQTVQMPNGENLQQVLDRAWKVLPQPARDWARRTPCWSWRTMRSTASCCAGFSVWVWTGSGRSGKLRPRSIFWKAKRWTISRWYA